MATSEAGGIVPEELRERLTRLIERGHVNQLHGADAVLAEIAAAGYVLVPSARMERLVEAMKATNEDDRSCGYMDAFELGRLMPGDLERPGEAE
jgi:hypothetical protein